MLTPSPPRTAGPRLSRRAVLASGVGLVATTAGCTDFLDEEEADSTDEALAADAPADATVLAQLDVAAIPDESADQVLGALADVEPAYVAGMTTAFEARTGLDALAATELVLFDAESDTDAATAGDVLVDADWSESEVVASLEERTGLEYAATTYHDESVYYEPSDSSRIEVDGTGSTDAEAIEPAFLGVHGDGRFVVGSETAVRNSLDVRYGDADSIAGPVRDAYDDALGAQLTVASQSSGQPIPPEYRALASGLNFEIFEEVDAVGRSYAAVDAGIALEIALHVDDERDAEELERVTRGAIGALAGLDAEFEEAREDVVLERDGTVVELTYEGDADVVFALLDEV